MEYEHTDEIKMLRQTVREFVDKEIRPIAHDLDEEERVPFEVIKKAGELGLLGVPFPEKYGGLEMGITGYEPKRRLGFEFVPLYIYAKLRNRMLRPVFSLMCQFLKFENFDESLKKAKKTISDEKKTPYV